MTDLDRDAARQLLRQRATYMPVANELEPLLDELEACVRPAPQQTIDRDALIRLLVAYETQIWEVVRRDYGRMPDQRGLTDRIIALLQPVQGVVLTREEAGYARRWLPTSYSQRARDLAARLDAAS